VNWLFAHYEWVIGVVLAPIVVVFIKHWLDSSRKTATNTVTQSPAITVSPTFNLPETGRTLPVQPELPLPNLVYAGSEQKPVYIGRWDFEGICDPHTEEQRKSAVMSLVLKFENRIATDRKIGRAMNVIAKMRFLLLQSNKVSERAIDYGVWLDSPCNSTSMEAGDTRELVVLCVVGDQLLTFRDKRTGNRNFGSEAFAYLADADIGNFDRVEITIIDQTSQANLSGTFKFWREGTSFYVVAT
jgi:hypothetical protein